jgi:hypothetical protein
MGKNTKVSNHPPVGGAKFLSALFNKAVEGDWIHVMYLAIIALNEKYQANGWYLNAEETENLGLAIQCLWANYQRSTEKQN